MMQAEAIHSHAHEQAPSPQPNRKERRRLAAQTKRTAGPSCGCGHAAGHHEHDA